MIMPAVYSATATDNSASTISRNNDLGREDFLMLLLEQMKAQDPMDPMQSADFTAQLAQFSSLEQQFNMNESLGDLLALQGGQSTLAASSLIGREVMAAGDSVWLDSGGTDLGFTLETAAARVVLGVEDRYGVPVRTLLVGDRSAGTQSVHWDGLDSMGNTMPPGDYRLTVRAYDESGGEVASSTMMTGVVQRVDLQNGEPRLIVNGEPLGINQIVRIMNRN